MKEIINGIDQKVLNAYKQGNYEFCEKLCELLSKKNDKNLFFYIITLLKISVKKNNLVKFVEKCNELFLLTQENWSNYESFSYQDKKTEIDNWNLFLAFTNILYLELVSLENQCSDKSFYVTIYGLVEYIIKSLHRIYLKLADLYLQIGLYNLAYINYDLAVNINPDSLQANSNKFMSLQLVANGLEKRL